LRGIAFSIAVAPVNVHRKLSGLQLGIINVAEKVDGVAIGILTLAGNGRLQPLLGVGSLGSAHLAMKSVAGHAFTQLGAGIGEAGDELTLDAGVGGHIRIGSYFVEPGVHYSSSQSTKDASGPALHHDLHYLVHVGLRLNQTLDLLLGAGAQHGVLRSTVGAWKPEARAGIGARRPENCRHYSIRSPRRRA